MVWISTIPIYRGFVVAPHRTRQGRNPAPRHAAAGAFRASTAGQHPKTTPRQTLPGPSVGLSHIGRPGSGARRVVESDDVVAQVRHPFVVDRGQVMDAAAYRAWLRVPDEVGPAMAQIVVGVAIDYEVVRCELGGAGVPDLRGVHNDGCAGAKGVDPVGDCVPQPIVGKVG